MSRKLCSKLIALVLVMAFSLSIDVQAEEIELDSDEQIEYIEEWNEISEEVDEFVDGLYNTNENARASMIGFVRLSKNGTKLQANYTTSYNYAVSKIGVKNVKLQYKSSLKIWYNILTLDDRYNTNDTDYVGGFTCTGTVGRTYRLKCTHYVVVDGVTKTSANVTGELNF